MMRFFFFLLALALPVMAQVSFEQKLLVEYPNGKSDSLLLFFHVQTTLSQKESGKPSSFLHPFDNRRCHTEIHSNLLRNAVLVLAGGQQMPYGPAQKTIPGEAKISRDYQSSCEEAKPEAEKQKAELQSKLVQELPEKMAQGLLFLSIQELQVLLGAKAIKILTK